MNGLVTHKQYVVVSKKLGIHGVSFVDDVIDRIRRKYNIVIYNTAEPFVSPNGKIEYAFGVKKCSPLWGWNARVHIGKTKWRTNIYQAKREAINITIKWILSHESQKSKKPKLVQIDGSNKKKQN